MKINTIVKEYLADFYTPVSVFLRLRQHYPQLLMLESSDYASKENSRSFICCQSLAHIALMDETLFQSFGNERQELSLTEKSLPKHIQEFVDSFDVNQTQKKAYNGVLGFTTYDCIPNFENIQFDAKKSRDDIPKLRYDLYRFVLVFEHFYDRMVLIENIPEGETSLLSNIERIVKIKDEQSFHFKRKGDIEASISDEDFKAKVTQCKAHCQRGDVFQIVISKRFKQAFEGDEFNVYRALRSINPSPYLFYYDYGDYALFGSSPEAQLIMQKGEAEIHPIAGTFRRSGDTEDDLAKAEELKADPKENAEHVMLVDLARNDLSRNGYNVRVDSYKKVQFFSHVIHLTSVVKGNINDHVSPYQVFADSFPAGTLSGAPKHKAMQLIDQMENQHRSFYGGALGMLGFDGSINHAIIIRSFLSKNHCLEMQAGAGIVIDSVEENENQEVYNKLSALIKALETAETI